jgi:inosine/xanthosine triphosphatase
MRVLVASKNPLKIQSVERAFNQVFPEEDVEIIGKKTASGVPDTPWNDDLRNGAKNRVLQLVNSGESYDYIVAIEAGVAVQNTMNHERYYLASYVFIRHRALPRDIKSDSFSSVLELPPIVISMLRDGYNLGPLVDKLSGEQNTKQKSGVDGFLTNGLITRGMPEETAIIHALSKFIHPELWEK